MKMTIEQVKQKINEIERGLVFVTNNDDRKYLINEWKMLQLYVKTGRAFSSTSIKEEN